MVDELQIPVKSKYWLECGKCGAEGPPPQRRVVADNHKGPTLPDGWFLCNFHKGTKPYEDCGGYEFTDHVEIFSGTLCPDCGKEIELRLGGGA